MFEQGVASEGVTLTLIGMGTAFGLLLLMMLVIVAVGRVVAVAERRADAPATTEQPVPERDKALAAVVAVSALRGRRADTAGSPSNDPHV